MKTPNGTDELSYSSLVSVEEGDTIITISDYMFTKLMHDYNYLLGKVDAYEWALKFYKEKYENKD